MRNGVGRRSWCVRDFLIFNHWLTRHYKVDDQQDFCCVLIFKMQSEFEKKKTILALKEGLKFTGLHVE